MHWAGLQLPYGPFEPAGESARSGHQALVESDTSSMLQGRYQVPDDLNCVLAAPVVTDPAKEIDVCTHDWLL